MKKISTLNLPLILITGFGVVATLFFLYLFVYNKATDTVKRSLTIQKAYPNIKPQEFINQLNSTAKEFGFSYIQIYTDNSTFLISLYSTTEIEKVNSISKNGLAYTVVNLVLYDLGNGTAIVGNNPYIWDIIYDSKILDEYAQEYSVKISGILDRVYLELKEKKKSI